MMPGELYLNDVSIKLEDELMEIRELESHLSTLNIEETDLKFKMSPALSATLVSGFSEKG